MKIKTLTFFSNYFNHHQKALCDAWYALLGDGFTFVETMPMEGFRAEMGWGEELPSYVLRTYESEEKRKRATELGTSSDLVVMGTAPEAYIEERLRAEERITFRYSERPLKEGFIKFFLPRLTKKYLHLHVRNRKKPIYILGASAFTALDYRKMFDSYPNKCYQFGYFPQHLNYNTDALLEKKREIAAGRPTILWMGRMLKLKRPDLCLRACAALKEAGYEFSLEMVGEGKERARMEAMAERLYLSDRIQFRDFLKPAEAREKMAEAMIYVMTSNRLEGWGSVIYEALNAGCAVVASHACGATPWLVKHRKTGLVFQSGSVASLRAQLQKLLDTPELTEQYGRSAYEQMQGLWNPETAAARVLILAEEINAQLGEMTAQQKRKTGYAVPFCSFEEGPCARASYRKNSWFKG